MTLFKELRLLPISADQQKPSTYPAQGLPDMVADLPEGPGAEVDRLTLHPVPPQIFHQIKFGAISQQTFQLQQTELLRHD